MSGRARRIHRLEEIGEQNENKAAAVQAIRALDGMEESAVGSGSTAKVPGLVFIINNGVSAPQPGAPQIPQQRVIEVNPLQSRETVSNAD